MEKIKRILIHDKKSGEFIYPDGSKVFFTSDTHFGHKNIIEWTRRPFDNVEEMNETLIENWNSVVGPDDVIYHLGDFAFGGSSLWKDVCSRLNGKKYLIIGNHDEKNLKDGFRVYFEDILWQAKLRVEGRSIYLNHFPFLCYGGTYRRPEDAVWQFHGHTHEMQGENLGEDYPRLQYRFPFQYDVGVDFNDYKPISFTEICEKIEKKIQESGYFSK
jgi:calcineurin-like phosphoesterase family protein